MESPEVNFPGNSWVGDNTGKNHEMQCLIHLLTDFTGIRCPSISVTSSNRMLQGSRVRLWQIEVWRFIDYDCSLTFREPMNRVCSNFQIYTGTNIKNPITFLLYDLRSLFENNGAENAKHRASFLHLFFGCLLPALVHLSWRNTDWPGFT